MNYADFSYGPLDDVLDALTGDNPPDDPVVLRMVLARCVAEVIRLREQATQP